MKIKKRIILLTLVIFLLSLANAYASEMDDTLASEDANQIEASSTVEDTLQASETLEQTDDNGAELKLTDEDELSSSGEFGELQKLIDDASDKSTINLERNYTYTIGTDTITEGISITKNLTINGNGFTIDAQGKSRILNIESDINVVLNNITFINGYTEGNGGAIFAYGNVDITGSRFINNTAVDGGAIENFNGKMTISESCFTSNNATEYGGALYNFNGEVKLTDACFTGNNATEYAGAIYNFAGNMNAAKSRFTRNAAGSNGGAVLNSFGALNISETCFIENTAVNGGAVYMGSGSVENCNFINNTANQSGGAVYVDGAYSDSKINSTFINNQAYNGGAIYFKGGISNVSIDGVYKDNVALRGGGAIFVRGNSMNNNFTSEFTGNEARAASGGAIFIYNQADNNRFEGIYRDNWALYGGGIFFYNKANNNVFNTEFINNTAKSCGGAMFFHNTTDGNNFTGDFTNNRALGQVDSENGNGGAITFKDTSSNSLFNSDFINNNASLNGGGVNYRHTPYNITFNSNFINNTSPRGGGVNFFETFENVVFNGEFIGNSADNGGAIATVGGIIMDVSFKDNHAEDEGGAVYFKGSGVVENCIFTNNTADYGGAVYIFGTGEVRDCVFINNTGFVFAGALMMIYGTVSDSSFTGNTAHIGGAVRINGEATVTRCNFTDNTATLEGGAVYLGSPGNVAFSNFIGNKATGDGVGGGAVLLYEGGNVSYSNFTNNHVSTDGGAVHFYDNGTLSDCNFYDNDAGANGGAVYFYGENVAIATNSNFTGNNADDGGAVYFYFDGNVTDCNFTLNTAEVGGAIHFDIEGDLKNSIFIENKAINNGGAVWIDSGTVEDCTFISNTADKYGGAVYFNDTGAVTNCNFTNNTASEDGGAIWMYSGSVENCNFTNNSASNRGGAVYFYGNGDVTNCNFTGNNANTGSAIYFYSTSATKTVSNSRFLNNRANAEALEVTKNYNNITITFTGKDNLLNAIYSRNDAEVTFTNVTYWSANGIAKTGSSAIKPSRSNKEAGQNITVSVIVNGKIVLTGVYLTDENGTIVLDIKAGENYFIGARHDTDSYYTEAEKTISNNTKFSVNVTSQTTNNRTVNITAKSNIPNEIIDGKLLFILPNGTQINATYGTNGTWWAVHKFDAYGDYQVNATYVGLDNVTITNATIGISKTPTEIEIASKSIDLIVRENASSDAFLIPSEAGNLTYVSSNELVAKMVDGMILAVGEGNATITVSFAGDDKYLAAESKIDVSVKKTDSSMDIEPKIVELIVGEEATFTVILPDDATGVVLVDVGDNKYYADVENGNATVKLVGLTPGNYTADVVYQGDDKYTNASGNIDVKVEDIILPHVTITVPEVKVGEEAKVIVQLPENATGTVSAIVDGKDVAAILVFGSPVTLPLGELSAGNHSVVVIYSGNKIYGMGGDFKNFTVDKLSTNVTAEPVEVIEGETATMIVVVDANATGLVLVDVGDNKYYADVASGKAVIDVAGLTAGNYTAKITYLGDSKFNSNLTSNDITVKEKVVSEIIIDLPDSFKTGENISVSIPDATGNVSVIFDGVESIVPLVDGNANYTLPSITSGEYSIIVMYSGDNTHTPAYNATSVYVERLGSQFNVTEGTTFTTYAVETGAGEQGALYAFVLRDSNGNPIANATVTFAYKTVVFNSTTDENGTLYLGISTYLAQDALCALSYLGDETHNATFVAFNFKIQKKPTAIKANAKTYKVTKKYKYLTVTLKTIKGSSRDGKTYLKKGKKITLTVNGKTYKGYTNANGKVTFTITNLNKKGKYVAVIKYAGSDTYTSAKTKVKLKVY